MTAASAHVARHIPTEDTSDVALLPVPLVPEVTTNAVKTKIPGTVAAKDRIIRTVEINELEERMVKIMEGLVDRTEVSEIRKILAAPEANMPREVAKATLIEVVVDTRAAEDKEVITLND